jgi:hypothetical protein
MRFEYVSQIKELISIVAQEVYFVFLALDDVFLFRKFLVFFANDTHSAPNVIFILVALPACQLVNE